jgi:ankyrin repeat protein
MMRGWKSVAAAVVLAMLALPAAADVDIGPNPIFLHARNGDTAAVDYLLRKGTSVQIANSAGETVLIIAAANGYLDMVELVLNNRARVDDQDSSGKTALCWAAERGHDTVVERLVKAGANVNHQNREGLTPLMFAVRAARAPTVRSLLASRPDLTLLDYTGRSVLGWARGGRDRRIEAMLIKAGAKD